MGAIIAGSVVGGLVVTCIGVATVVFYRRCRSTARGGRTHRTSITGTVTEQQRIATSLQPYSDREEHDSDGTGLRNIGGTTNIPVTPEGWSPTRQPEKTRETSTPEDRPGRTEIPFFDPQDSWMTSGSGSLFSAEVARARGQPLSSSSDNGTSTVLQSPTMTEDVVGLRAEVQNLRRVMEQIRVERFESPPEYQDHQYR